MLKRQKKSASLKLQQARSVTNLLYFFEYQINLINSIKYNSLKYLIIAVTWCCSHDLVTPKWHRITAAQGF